MMSIHADGAFLVSRAAFRRMKASGKGGRIVFTGSVQSFVGSKLKEPYNFAKHGVAGLAKAIAGSISVTLTVDAVFNAAGAA